MDKTFSQLMKYIKPHFIAIFISLFLTALCAIESLLVPLVIGKILDIIIQSGFDLNNIFSLIEELLGIIIFEGLGTYISHVLNNKVVYEVVSALRNDAFIKLQKLPVKYFDSRRYGEIASVIMSDAQMVGDGLLLSFTNLFEGVILIVATLVVMFKLSYSITIFILIVTPISIFITNFISKKSFKFFAMTSESRGTLTGFIEEMITNEKIVRAFHHEKKNQENFKEMNDELDDNGLKATFVSSLVNPLTRFLSNVTYAGVIFMGCLSIQEGLVSIGTLLAFLSFANSYAKPFNEISDVITEFQNALACARRIFEILNADEIRMIEEDIGYLNGKVSFKDVSFGYNDNLLFNRINFETKVGDMVAIVGPTGAGKSTMINLLLRFYDANRGVIAIDNKDIYDYSHSSLRDNYGMVLQETWLKSDTVMNNLKLGKKDASDEEVIEVCKITHADNFIRQLKDGYNTYLKDNGEMLSLGQRQLLCVSRVMLTKPSILVLDEATSSIDVLTEREIQKAFVNLVEGNTSFVVAHRLLTIMNADLILVMNKGQIVEQGSHEELLNKKGFYYELWNSQFVRREEQ